MTGLEDRFVAAGDTTLHYLDGGRGAPVVWLHGLGSMVEDPSFDILGLLADDHRALAFDRPGCGRSARGDGGGLSVRAQARTLLAAFGRLGLARPVVVGHSLGALVALAMALEAPERLGGVVLVAGYYYPQADLRTVAGWAVLALLAASRGAVARSASLRGLRRLMARTVFAPDPVPAGFFDVFSLERLTEWGSLATIAAEARGLTGEAARLGPFYPALALPVALVAGDDDRLTPLREQALRFKRAVPRAELFLAAGHGHMVHHADSAIVRRALGWVERSGSRTVFAC